MSLPLTANRGAGVSGAISLLPIDIIHPNPYQPRTHFDPSALEQLCASVKTYGILQPITVRRLGGGYELVAGERRLRAAKMANLTSVPAVIVNLNEEDTALVALLENLQRCDLSFLEEAEGYEKLIRLHGMTQEQIAQKIGKTQSAVANKLRLLKLPTIVKKKLREHNLTERHARALLRLGDNCKLQTIALERIVARTLNVSQTEQMIEKLLAEDKAEPARRKRVIQSGLKVATNTLRQAVQMITQAGIPAVLKEKKADGYVEYTITLPL